MHTNQIQGCIAEHRVGKKRKIAECVWVHIVVTVRTGKVAGQCAMPVIGWQVACRPRTAAERLGVN